MSKVASDLIGPALGQSEQQTKSILKESEGCVLLIDEAYTLNPKGSVGQNGGGGNPYKEAAIDAIVESVQNIPGEDRCVLLLGYRPQMEQLLDDANPGLKRRFPNLIEFADYSEEELNSIFVSTLRRRDLKASPEVLRTVTRQLKLRKREANFGNGGTVNELISKAVMARTARVAKMPPSLQAAEREQNTITEADVTATAAKKRSIEEIFSQVVGCHSVLNEIRSLQKLIERASKCGNADPFADVPFNFLFLGPPGTGQSRHTTRNDADAARFASMFILCV